MAILIGIAAAIVYFHTADRWAYIKATGSPKFEMPEWWMIGESAITGIFATILVVGVSAGIYRIHHVRSAHGISADTRPASKVSVNDTPSKPTSKEGPR